HPRPPRRPRLTPKASTEALGGEPPVRHRPRRSRASTRARTSGSSPTRSAGQEEQLERGGAEDEREEDRDDDGGAGSHGWLRGVRVTGWTGGRGPSSSPGSRRRTSVPTARPSSPAALRRSMQMARSP